MGTDSPPTDPQTPRQARRAWLGAALAGALGGLAGCASPRPAAAPPLAAALRPPGARVLPFSGGQPGQLPAGWQPYAIRKDLAHTRYGLVREGQRQVLHARARASATGLICPVQIDPARNRLLQWSWRVREVPPHADVGQAVHDDCPARLIVAFDGDTARLGLRDRLFFDQVELFTGQRLPFATLMYVWDGGSHPVDSVHRNHRTGRIQYLAVDSGPGHAGQWRQHQRDIAADYRRVFGEAPGPVIGVGVLTDADALKLQLEAWYGDISLLPAPAAEG